MNLEAKEIQQCVRGSGQRSPFRAPGDTHNHSPAWSQRASVPVRVIYLGEQSCWNKAVHLKTAGVAGRRPSEMNANLLAPPPRPPQLARVSAVKPLDRLYTMMPSQLPFLTKQHHWARVMAFDRRGAQYCFQPFHQASLFFLLPVYARLSRAFSPHPDTDCSSVSYAFSIQTFPIHLF